MKIHLYYLNQWCLLQIQSAVLYQVYTITFSYIHLRQITLAVKNKQFMSLSLTLWWVYVLLTLCTVHWGGGGGGGGLLAEWQNIFLIIVKKKKKKKKKFPSHKHIFQSYTLESKRKWIRAENHGGPKQNRIFFFFGGLPKNCLLVHLLVTHHLHYQVSWYVGIPSRF